MPRPRHAGPATTRRPGRSLSGLIVGFSLLGLAIVLLSIGTQIRGGGTDHGRPRRACLGNLQSIAIALLNYHDVHGAFPPARLMGPDGRPWHSWRVLILPYLGEDELFSAYDFAQPWDAPANRALLDRMPRAYRCPSADRSGSLSGVAALTGPGTLFPEDGPTGLRDVADGADRTLMVVEVARPEIPWTAPADLDIRTMSFRLDDADRPSISSGHPDGPSGCTVSGRPLVLGRDLSPDEVRALATVAAGDQGATPAGR